MLKAISWLRGQKGMPAKLLKRIIGGIRRRAGYWEVLLLKLALRPINGVINKNRGSANNGRALVVYPGFGGWTFFNNLEINVSFLRKIYGFHVDAMLCNKAVEACDFISRKNFEIDDKSNLQKDCSRCIYFAKNRLEMFVDQIIYQNQLIEQEDIEKVDKFIEKLGPRVSQNFYCSQIYDGINVGKHAYESLQYLFRAGSIDEINLIPGAAPYEYLKSTILNSIVAFRLLENYEIILINDAGKSLWGTVSDVAFKLNKKVLFCGYNSLLVRPPKHDRDVAVVHYNEMVSRLHRNDYEFRFRYNIFPGVKRVNPIINEPESYPALIEKGKEVVGKRLKPQKTRDEVYSSLGLTDDKPIVVIFTHLCWDNSLAWGHLPIKSFEEWLSITYSAALTNKNVNWIFKFHPGEINRINHPLYNTARHMDSLIKAHPADHIKVIDTTDITTGDLVPLMWAGITVVGTVNYELPGLGINCVTLTNGIHSGFGFTTVTHSIPDYVEMLSRIDKLSPLTDKAIMAAQAYTGLLYSNGLSIVIKEVFPHGHHGSKFIKPFALKRFTRKNSARYKEMINRENL
jgi:hypothetical protein